MKAMIISVGGTSEPVVASLLEHRPRYVCFFASQQSIDTIGEIKTKVSEKGLKLKDYKVICDDVDSIIHCYEKALKCTDNLADQNLAPGNVVVDYTGGTKTMTAALTLATVGHGYAFSYVGGKKRTKGGLGVVVTGTEVIKQGVSPWQLFAVEEKKRISLFVSSFQYEAAISTLRNTMQNLEPGQREIWDSIAEALEGYLAWDNFNHKIALRRLKAGLKRLEICEKLVSDKPLTDYVGKVGVSLDVLEDIEVKTSSFKKMHPILIRDLLSNAERRYIQNKYDDAVARLYRALELAGQIAFEVATGCPTSSVSVDKLPKSIREEYAHKYTSKNDKLKIPLFATFRALKEMDHPTGRKYFQNENNLKKILSARNNSILAHGIGPVEKESYEKFSEIIRDLLVECQLIEFPQLHW